MYIYCWLYLKEAVKVRHFDLAKYYFFTLDIFKIVSSTFKIKKNCDIRYLWEVNNDSFNGLSYWFVYISNYENNSDDKVSEKFIAIE